MPKLLSKKILVLSVVLLVILAHPLWAQSIPSKLLTKEQIQQALAELPRGERWIRHVQEDIMPFWLMESALGEELGNFPSYRDNRGQTVDFSKPKDEQPIEIQGGMRFGLISENKQYLRTRSRQIFGYCIAFLMTGEDRYLELAYAGIEHNFLTEGRFYNAIDGTLMGYYDPRADRYFPGTSQDWAYGLCGPAFYYYITKDERVLPIVLKGKEKVFDEFFDPGFGMFRWVTAATATLDNSQDRREIVANLDQIYAYMLMVHRSLPEAEQAIWKRQLHELAVILLKEFYGTREGFFFGQATKPESKYFGAEHTDFGHSTKTFWLIMQIGRLTGDVSMEMIGRQGAARLVDMAYDPKDEAWHQKFAPSKDGRELVMVSDREWWSQAIMNQTAATLSLRNPDFLRYISKTHRFWFEQMVDHENKEIWHMVKPGVSIAPGTYIPDTGFPKMHAWKTCFHSMEHALIMYLVSKHLHGEKPVLYFVRSERDYTDTKQYYPYLFEGQVSPSDIVVKSREFLLPNSNVKRIKVEVSFGHVR